MENKNQPNDKNETFEYTYSPTYREEVQSIREKYAPTPKTEDKLETLRRLDNKVYQKATAISMIVGIIGALILGVGMCCTLVWKRLWFIPGIAIGILGIAIVSANYPLYKKIIHDEKEKIAPQILRLTDELLK